MKIKPQQELPADLAGVLRNARMLLAWSKLRPSCQSDYIQRIENAGAGEPRKREIEKILKFTNKYAHRHPNKSGTRKKVTPIN